MNLRPVVITNMYRGAVKTTQAVVINLAGLLIQHPVPLAGGRQVVERVIDQQQRKTDADNRVAANVVGRNISGRRQLAVILIINTVQHLEAGYARQQVISGAIQRSLQGAIVDAVGDAVSTASVALVVQYRDNQSDAVIATISPICGSVVAQVYRVLKSVSSLVIETGAAHFGSNKAHCHLAVFVEIGDCVLHGKVALVG